MKVPLDDLFNTKGEQWIESARACVESKVGSQKQQIGKSAIMENRRRGVMEAGDI